jgi:peptide/nickel transport system substrate-binding protein
MTYRVLGPVLAALLLAGCPGSPPPLVEDGEPAAGGTAVIGELSDLHTWNPCLAEDQTALEILSLVYPSLAVEQPDYRLHPPSFKAQLAKSWRFSEDGLEIVFTLDERAVWSDGTPVTAADVVFSWQAQTSPEVAWLWVDSKEYIEEVEAVDPQTVRFRFSRSYPYQLVDAVEGLIVPAHAWSGIPFEQWRETDWSELAMSAGPFRKGSHAHGQELVLERFDRYWRPGRPYLDRVVWRPVPSKTTLLNQLLTGDIDFLNGVPPDDAERVRQRPGLQLVLYPDRGYTQIRWNLRREFFADAATRRALTMAIDRDAIIDVAYSGYARLAVGPVLSDMWAFNRDLEALPFDPEESRRLLEQAGWSDRDGDGLLDRDGESFDFELLTNSESELRKDICILVEGDLAKIGVRARLRFVEWGTLLELEESGDFDAIVSRWIEPTLIDLAPVWHSAEPKAPSFNYGGYSNSEVDRLLAQVAEMTDFRDQKPLLDRIQALIVADQPYTFLVESIRLVGMTSRLRGVEANAASPYFNLEEWYVETVPTN